MPLLTMLQELDVDELIANREEMHTRLGSMTRAIQSRNFAGMPAGASFDALLPSIDDSEHQEFLVTDGSKVSRGFASSIDCVLSNVQGLFQAAHLAGENDLRGIIRTFQIDTYTATGTPPQAAGVNSNTERVCPPHSSMCAAAHSDLGCRFREDYKLCA